MIDILKFVLAIYILVKFLYPIKDDIDNIKNDILLIEGSIKKYENYIKDSNLIDKDLKKAKEIDEINKNLLFTQKSTYIFTYIQSIIKKSIPTATIKWGDVIEEKGIKYYPIEAKFRTVPDKIGDLYKNLCKDKKIFLIKKFKINAINKKKFIDYQIVIEGIKIDN